MKLSKQTEDAIDVLVYMGQRGGQMTAQEAKAALGRRGEMWSVLRTLSQAGILISKIGRTGGFALAKPLKEVTLMDVIVAVEGVLFPGTGDGNGASSVASVMLRDAVCNVASSLAMRDLVEAA